MVSKNKQFQNYIAPYLCTMLVYIRKTPNLVSGMGAFSDALKLSPRISRVCLGSMTPSSHSLALKKIKKKIIRHCYEKLFLDINRGHINNISWVLCLSVDKKFSSSTENPMFL